jgi:cephalosporin hydroxylase
MTAVQSDLAWEGDVLRAGSALFDTSFDATFASTPGAFKLYKGPANVRDLTAVLALVSAPCHNVLELGIYRGGSVVLWNELLRPARLSAIDLAPSREDETLREYLASDRGRGVRLHWEVDQGDRAALERVLATDELEPLDLVVDDGSHMLDLTTTSFNILFPRLRPGGWYLIEDWAWDYLPPSVGMPDFGPDHPWAMRRSPVRLVERLLRAVPSRHDAITRIEVLQTVVGIQRGDAELPVLDATRLARRRPQAPLERRVRNRLKPMRRWVRRRWGI